MSEHMKSDEPDGGPVVVAMLALFLVMGGLAALLWAVFA